MIKLKVGDCRNVGGDRCE